MKKFILGFALALLLIFINVDHDVEASNLEGWHLIQGKEMYFQNGKALVGLNKIGNTTYLFDINGAKQKGWHNLGGKHYYFSPDHNGGMITGIRKVGNTTYLFNRYGFKEYGWHNINGHHYFFSDYYGGGMVTGKRVVGTTTYLFNNNGQKVYGWHNLNGQHYYFSPEHGGGMITGLRTINGAKYNFHKDGYKQFGWFIINGKEYFFDEYKNGMLTQIIDPNVSNEGTSNAVPVVGEAYQINTIQKGYYNATDAKNLVNSVNVLSPGTYYVYKIHEGMLNLGTKKDVAGAWINPGETASNHEPKNSNLVEETDPFVLVLDPGHGAGASHNRGGVLFNEGDQNYHFSKVIEKAALKYENVVVKSTRNNINDNPDEKTVRGPAGNGSDLFISIHTNAVSSPLVRGVEIWGSNDNKNHQLAVDITNMVETTLSTPNRGVKYDIKNGSYKRTPQAGQDDTWWVFLQNGAEEKILIETVFHTNFVDSKAYLDNQEVLATKMMEIIARHYNLKLK